MDALSQLSYSPTRRRGKVRIYPRKVKPDRARMRDVMTRVSRTLLRSCQRCVQARQRALAAQ